MPVGVDHTAGLHVIKDGILERPSVRPANRECDDSAVMRPGPEDGELVVHWVACLLAGVFVFLFPAGLGLVNLNHSDQEGVLVLLHGLPDAGSFNC